MSTHLNTFNRVARFYDLAKTVVFGKEIYESKTHFIKTVALGQNILIIGGGSGETLPLIMRRNPQAQIWFVDASSDMLRLARRRMKGSGAHKIRFIHSTTDEWLPEGVVFDAVITDFFFDLFTDKRVAHMVCLIAGKLRANGIWLAADFVDTGKPWQKMLLWSMYRFFVMACDIEARFLPAWQHQIASAGMDLISASAFYGGFIRSTVYRKRETLPSDT